MSRDRELYGLDDTRAELSREGRARRAEMLELLERELGRRRAHRRRLRVAALAGLCIVGGVLSLGWIALRFDGGGGPATSEDIVEESTRWELRRIDFDVVRNAGDVFERSRVRSAVRFTDAIAIDDDELLSLLAQAGRPEGLVRVEGRLLLSSDLSPEEAGTDL